ncbi:putative ATP-grasp-modified RiPP [Nonomuraea jabiensis]|uniref:putative ATP-grasp-modified RiPP n=1 Tax=Nonomuraea jabiensis TaxID=882448 RepID=UPI003D737E1C
MPIDQLARPWGMSRATAPLPEAALPWVSTELDPETQLTIFHDDQGKPVDIFAGTNRTYPTVSMSKPGDGSKDAAEEADDSPTDIEMD